jgi:c-di-GMP phosphodiesterase
MRRKHRFRSRSMTFRQARLILLAALAVGCIAFAIQAALLTGSARDALYERECQLLGVAEDGAVAFLQRGDPDHAQALLRDILRMPGVIQAEIRDLNGVALATERAAIEPRSMTSWERWLAGYVFGAYRIDHPLTVGGADGEPRIGSLIVDFAPDRDVAFYREILLTNLISSLVAALVVGGVVSWLFHRFLTQPILAITRQVDAVDAEDPHGHMLSVPAWHRDSELGTAVQRINALLMQLGVAQNALRRMSTRDAATNLPNRALIVEHLGGVVGRCSVGRSGAVMAVLMDRLDEFRDVVGHDRVDEMVLDMAAHLLECVEPGAFVGRIGFDCFAVVVEGVTAAEAAESAKRLVNALVREPSGGEVMLSSVCVGIALTPGDGVEAAELLRKAVAATSGARKRSQARWNFFEDGLSEIAHHRLQLEAQLHHALEASEFELNFQPQFSAQGVVIGAEALVRWRHEGNLVLPNEFIPLAEDSGLVVPIGDYVLEEACRALAQLRYFGLMIKIAVNISPQQLADAGFVGRVSETLERHRIPPSALELEITEYTLAMERGSLLERIRALRALGISIALDDFGTGYSSLSYLRRFPVDVLKIDRSFVTDIPNDIAVPSTILTLAEKLGMTCVAEGIETVPQRDWLIANGCHALQGFLFARPMSFTEFFARYATIGGAVDLRFHRERHVVDG